MIIQKRLLPLFIGIYVYLAYKSIYAFYATDKDRGEVVRTFFNIARWPKSCFAFCYLDADFIDCICDFCIHYSVVMLLKVHSQG